MVLALPRVGQAGLSIPRELPRPPADFTGRAGELASLWELLGADALGLWVWTPSCRHSPGRADILAVWW